MKSRILITILALLSTLSVIGAADSDAVLLRVRTELATLLKKDASSLAVDKPVQQLGADELHIVEWVMAVEEAFQVILPDEKLIDKKTVTARKDLSIALMSQITNEAIASKKKKK